METERLPEIRDYFESGCICIRDGKIQRLSQTVDNVRAVHYYETACRCSRNYKSLEAFLAERENCSIDPAGDIVSIPGRVLRIEHVPDHAPELEDYWFAWVDGFQWDGTTRNRAIQGALKQAIAKELV